MKFSWDLKKHSDIAPQDEKDLTKYSSDQLLDAFKSDNWNQLNSGDKIAVLQEMENRTATYMGRPIANIVPLNDSATYGTFNGHCNSIFINIDDFNSFEVLDTYVHESNHALQEQCILTDENVDRHFSAMLQVENARDDNGRLYNYIQPDADRDYEYNVLYYLQCNELDSNNQAASFMLSQQNRYGHEEGYHNYIQERTHYFCNINSAIDNYRENRQNLQRSQINEAYTRGDISDKQYELLSAHISDDRYEDVAVKECRTIAGEVNELNNKFNAELEISKSAQSEYLGSVCDGVQVAFVDGSEKVSPNNITADSPNDYLGTTKNMSNKTYSNSFVASKTSEMEQSL